MSKIISSIFVSLDGYAAKPDRSINWFPVNQEFFDYAGFLTEHADTAIYGRKTYEIMQSYWPTAANEPDAGEHEIQHGAWYNKSRKIVFSKTLTDRNLENTLVLGTDAVEQMKQIKNDSKADMVVFGSPQIVDLLTESDLIDEYYLFIAPIILVDGIGLFKNITNVKNLILVDSKQFDTGVMMLHYQKTV